MATMKDVAKHAGVSHGTVSNIINGAKGVSLDKVRRVEKAMKELGYKPNAFARNLKTNKTMQIDVILPNISDNSLSQLFACLSTLAIDNKYSLDLKITNEIAEIETDYLNRSFNKDGVILMTCQPQNTELFEGLLSDGLKMVFIQRQIDNIDHNFVKINIKDIIKNHMEYLYEKGIQKIAIITGPAEYTFEKDCLDAYLEFHDKIGAAVNADYHRVSNYSREGAMKAAVRLLQIKEPPQVIIATNHEMAAGIVKAIDLISMPDQPKPQLLVIGAVPWTNIRENDIREIPLPYNVLAEAVFNILIESIETPTFGETKNIGIDPVFHNNVKNPPNNIAILRDSVSSRPVRVLLLESPNAYATESLLPHLKKKNGIDVIIETRRYSELFHTIRDTAQTNRHDVYLVDIPWINEFVYHGVLENLDAYMENEERFIGDFLPEVFENYTSQEGSLFVLPYMYCSQLLFYRKDLFESIKNQRLFYEKYRTELRAPKTWNEFNVVARFFTRKYNPDSETLYGTTLGSRMSSGAVNEFLPRLWYFGGSVFENGNVALNSRQAIKALENYCESFNYASEYSHDHWWDEQVSEFCAGDAAMMILYNAHASDVSDRSKSKVAGKIGFEIIPGKISVMGGWSLGINSNSRNKHNAYDFIKWACSKEIAVPSTILGGCSACKIINEDAEIATMYPWQRKAVEGFKFARKRFLPKTESGKCISEHEFEEILGEAVYNTVTKKTDARTALSIASQKIEELINKDKGDTKWVKKLSPGI